MVDQTPEQRQQRLGKEYGSLPEVQRTDAQKEADILEQREEYKRIGIEKLTSRLIQEMQEKNQSIGDSNRRETTALWDINPEAIRLFSERAYRGLEGEEAIFNNDIEKGYWGIRNEIKEIDGKIGKTTDEENQIDYLKHRAEKIEELQKEALVPMITWQLHNELAQAMGMESLNAEDFVNEVDRISGSWPEEENRHSYYIKKAGRYRESLPRDTRTAILREISINPEGFSPWGTYFEGILQDIADFSRKRADNLSLEDLGTVMAYYTVALEEGIYPVDYENLISGIEFGLQHILKNSSNEDLSVNNLPDFIRTIRYADEIKGKNGPDFRDITRAYQHMASDARAFDLVTNFYRSRF
jgi:hypothetical protein